ncbi:glycoside hydrolase family 88 protein [Streptomyces sp. NPDC091217]|uniref:glycoside hydrolase family 88 protein n=1 Tax=Streptomyces sp. NPDC091217 TaxID=3365975 RepID=UPI003810DEDD
MAGEDLTSSRFAAPPRPPLSPSDLGTEGLLTTARQLTERTWELGLPAFFWGEGVCLLGMVRVAEAAGETYPERVREWLTAQARRDIVPDHVNHLAPGTAAVLADTPEFSPLTERLRDWAFTDPAVTRDPNGAIEHWPGGVWADTVFMAGVFFGHLGEARQDPSLVAEFGRQLIAHAEILQDRETGLYVHGSHGGTPVRCFWGRANAWCALGSVEYLELAHRSPHLTDPATVDAVTASLTRQLTALARRQPEHGVWSVLVDDQPENAGILETSAAAGIGAAMLRAARVLPDPPAEVAAAGWRAVAGALAYLDDGILTRVSAGTVLQLVPFGYSVIRDDRPQPWGQGLALHAVAAALAAGGHPAPAAGGHAALAAGGQPRATEPAVEAAG